MIRSPIKSVSKALKIIDFLAEARRDVSLGEIAKEMNLAKSTAYGLLATLRDFDYVEQSPFDGKYRLGIRLFEVGNVVANTWDVRQIAGPHIEYLVDNLGETVHLVILDKGEVLYIDKRESKQSLRIVSQVGNRLPAHCTGVGKVLLAHLPAGELKRLLAVKGLKRYTKNTITEEKVLLEELKKIGRQGYSIDDEEIMDGLRCVAVPIRNFSGKVIAGMSVSGPTARLDGERLESIIEHMLKTGQDISASLGYRSGVGGNAHGCS
ncbi:IclR family transcriptional regulator [Acididesulfobacillus acetoxydans]|uniref:IclR family transcriptional regulator n=1 Tax=Acididesulfobacillus acetoxydans TaxID=1561005 RepID=UPI001F0D329A|nr:IclR family transcriptional regulator [Acididesulfobacillus acetoxydans]